MYNDSLEEEEDDVMDGGLRSRFGRWVGQLTGRIEEEEEYEDHVAAQATRPVSTVNVAAPAFQTQHSAPRRDTFRVSSGSSALNGNIGMPTGMSRESWITVMPASNFADVQKAADRLKMGEPQIVNLEKTPPDVAERLIDFLNGVTYALDGYVERIADGAYLFTPSNIAIRADAPESAPKPFFDRL